MEQRNDTGTGEPPADAAAPTSSSLLRRSPLLLAALAGSLVFVLVAATLALTSRSGGDDDQGIEGPLGTLAATAADALTYRAVDTATGSAVTLDDLRGHPTLLAAWATWCAPCRTELPRLERLARERAASGLRVVTVNVDDDGAEKAVGQWITDLHLTMPVWRDRANTFMPTFETPVLPAAVLLDANGVVVQRWVGLLRTSDRSFTKQLDRVTSKAVTSAGS